MTLILGVALAVFVAASGLLLVLAIFAVALRSIWESELSVGNLLESLRDPMVGRVVADHQVLSRVRGSPAEPKSSVYEVYGGTLVWLDPQVDVSAYQKRIDAAQALCPEARRVKDAIPGALVLQGPDPGPGGHGPWSVEEAFSVCVSLVRLHTEGMGHGGLATHGVVAMPGELQLGPVAPAGTVAADMAWLRAGLPAEAAHLDGTDARDLAKGLLRMGRPGPLGARTVVRCEQCGEDAFLRGRSWERMMDGVKSDGRRVGGRTTWREWLCVACGRFVVEHTMEAY